MFLLDRLAEQRIAEAMARGEFDDLPGAGQPLELDDDTLVPEELRVAYRLLKNAGFVPPEVEARRELASLEELLACTDDAGERDRALKKLHLLSARLHGDRLSLEQAYYQRLLERLSRR